MKLLPALFSILGLLFFNSISAQNIDDGAWRPYGLNNGNTNGTIIEIKFHPIDSSLIATGFFTEIQGENHSYIASRDSGSWKSIGNGLIDGGHSIEFINDTLYSAGYQFQLDSNWLFYYDNSQWQKLGRGFYLSGASLSSFYTCNLFDVIEWNNQIVVCGEFDRVGEDTIYGIAAWDGQSWNPLGSGLSVPFFGLTINPHQLMVDAQGDLWVCGNFKEAGDSTVNGIARWDGTNWHPVGEGFNSTVYAMIEYQNEIYSGGAFTRTGTDTVLRAAKWDGTKWVNPGFGLNYVSSTNRLCFVHTIKEVGPVANVSGGLVFAGGFNRLISDPQGTQVAGNIALLADNGDVFTLDAGLNETVEGIEYQRGNIISAGIFTESNANPNQSLGGISEYNFLQGIHTHEHLHSMDFYPNPGSDYIFIESQEEELDIQIFDLTGRKKEVNAFKVKGGFSLDISNIKSGIYLISVSKDGQIISKKVSIE